MNWEPDGRRFVNESRSTPIWVKLGSNTFGESWRDTKTSLLGTRANWVAAPLVSIVSTRKDFHLAKHLLVDSLTGRKLK
jgi:hypothetical protein